MMFGNNQALPADRKSFQKALVDLAKRFQAEAAEMRRRGYDEATLRLEYLDPLFSGLGWNVWNNPPQPLHLREVVVENRTEIRGRTKRVDYAFRTNGLERWICEAKKPFDNIDRHYFQLQNYTYNMRLWLGVLSDFEHFIVFVVGGRPSRERPFSPVPGWRLHFTNYESLGTKIWDLLSREAVESGEIERFIQKLGKVGTGAKQGWLIKPDRTKTVDAEFLKFLENERSLFAKDLVKSNPDVKWTGPKLADALQSIIDRLLFQRVSEDRGIDVGMKLQSTLNSWEGRGQLPGQLWPMVAGNFRHLAGTFNGGVFGKNAKTSHAADNLRISDRLIADFIEEIAGDSSEWLFGTMPLWLLGSVYERFLGSEIDAKGNVVPKIEARKAGGVYYTPESVVRAVVDKTIGPLLAGRSPTEIMELKIIDPSCGSGSFLLAVYSRLLHHCLDWFTQNRGDAKPQDVFEFAGSIWLTTSFKRRVLKSCVFGVDIDPVAVQVARMSLCLRVLEDETQEALSKELTLFPKETFLPDLDENIIHANSLVPVSAYPKFFDEEYVSSSNAIDWSLLLSKTARKRGFDAVVGNPPWGADVDYLAGSYLRQAHQEVLVRMPDTYIYFTHLSVKTLSRRGGRIGLVLPGTFLNQSDAAGLRRFVLAAGVEAVADLGQGIFQGALNTSSVFVCQKGGGGSNTVALNDVKGVDLSLREAVVGQWQSVPRKKWEDVVGSDPLATFFTSELDGVGALSLARDQLGTLRDLVDDFGIQRGVTPDILEAHLLSAQEAVAAKIEESVLRNTLRGEHIKSFHRAVPTAQIIYTTSGVDPKRIPFAIAYMGKFRSKITCKEVRDGRHPWWRLHRPRDPAIFDRAKIIGLTTTRKIELIWDENQSMVVTDAMYVFGPRANTPPEYLLGLMQSDPFANYYRLANQGDARVIPQIKATKLLDVPIPKWNPNDRTHQEIVNIVKSLLKLSASDSLGAQRAFKAQRRNLETAASRAYGVSPVESDIDS